MCVPNTGCTGPSDRLEEGGCNHCYFVHRDQNLSQISCLAENDDTCINGTYLNFPFDPVEPFPFPTRFCDNCHEQCKPCNASMRQCTTCNGPGPTSCSECRFALRDGVCVSIDQVIGVTLTCGPVGLINQCNATWLVSSYIRS